MQSFLFVVRLLSFLLFGMAVVVFRIRFGSPFLAMLLDRDESSIPLSGWFFFPVARKLGFLLLLLFLPRFTTY